ncbi:hypothetical protein A3D42_00255 [Candidatus Nomurabacteria bacterium RIFCSPHIGHO2_02_FULL_41_18]|uniref:Transcriptional repressor PaaX-like central Cas2-like domain-containing protein n=1 Tax=Candidatus Nomurabacteria bacterium RIFCSPHIGHO2_02_FULL_41_18 TaxID=1801754 RepID=A0A1F6W7R4_9BACT|nr:MAG: hypothetical protein A2737_02465 [Candidatus Nomurabacteria bacterium RIFCSPHIGHO2_01_FULL_41_71]OGI77933.1 MAG: hypothetical protein A3D42_00255 [Candidatus Nomurabacteria bacterium RIFCSPHIGHO2_02_FULL_41_18]OGI89575.1 MAG: hypothetical protein A3B01_00280 [Candidatus Nomurabacteria bacterium RIFCSPLOWO2_01_FULL_41_52b]OGJ00161.1 MAG: hypothetical protein A3I90_00150 [Candidatus Nomurabacteria bacterium RIFCSPLOWO2_02_FULL_41_9]
MKGKILYQILDFIEDTSLSMIDINMAILSAGYGASMGEIDRKYEYLAQRRDAYKMNRDKKRHLQIYLSKLKSEGLITENSLNKITLSLEGKKKLNLLKKRKILNKNSYKKEKGDRMIIVSYDIPVFFNKERAILRDILRRLGFNIVHKSVWIGKVKLPKEFILAVGELGIHEFIEILEVTKNGSLKSI